jgi:hypothetical protein
MDDSFKKEILEKIGRSLCTCGHPRSDHNRLVDHAFSGCLHDECECDRFIYDLDVNKPIDQTRVNIICYNEREMLATPLIG